MVMRGKWAQGIVPRGFTWIIKDRIAVSERPGGCGEGHRRVRRQEEIIWIRENGFNTVLSLLGSDHNLHNYDDFNQDWVHVPFGGAGDGRVRLEQVCRAIDKYGVEGQRLLVHREELNDVVCGVMGAWLLWSGLVPTGPQAISFAERLIGRPMGAAGREVIGLIASPDLGRSNPTSEERSG
ncbi:MAG: hypothetical protein P8M16_10890 [Acidimicrobiales bacterium]|nr:hypothetical protein [Acidimicrobiales bacterium]